MVSERHVLSIVAAGVGLLVLILSLVTLSLPWTTYTVDEEIRFDGHVLSSDLYRHWPQLHYTHSRHLKEYCFADMDDVTWRVIFGLKPQLVSGTCRGHNSRCKKSGHCMDRSKFNQPRNATDYNYTTAEQLGEEVQQNKLFKTSYGLIIPAIILSFFFWLHLYETAHCLIAFVIWLRTIGQVAFMVAVNLLYDSGEAMDNEMYAAPHYGFVRNNAFLSSVTSRKNGSAHGCSWAFVAFSCVELILSLAAVIAVCVHHREDENYVERGLVDSIQHRSKVVRSSLRRSKKDNQVDKAPDDEVDKAPDEGSQLQP